MKEESTAESKLEDSYPVQDTLGNWGTNVKNPQVNTGNEDKLPCATFIFLVVSNIVGNSYYQKY